jgi:hypothetical protein
MLLLVTEGAAVTGTVTLPVAPPQAMVKVALPGVAGVTTRVPLMPTCPDQAPEASHVATPVFCAFHVKVNDCPAKTVDGLAEMFTDGCAGVTGGATGVLEPPPPHAASARQATLATSKAEQR